MLICWMQCAACEPLGGPRGAGRRGVAAWACRVASAGSRAGPGAALAPGFGNTPGTRRAVGLKVGLARGGAKGRVALRGWWLVAPGDEMGLWGSPWGTVEEE